MNAYDNRVQLIYLPPGEGGRKIGLDDFFVSGGTVEQLLSYATPILRPHPSDDNLKYCLYEATATGLVWNRQTRDGPERIPLANFSARIERERFVTDGVETKRVYELSADCNGHHFEFSVAASAFSSMNWVADHLGASAYLYPGNTIRDHARVAIQRLSDDIKQIHVFSHTGWCNLPDGRAAYLHGGGAVTQDGHEPCEVDLPHDLAPFRLEPPSTQEALRRAVRVSLNAWDLCRGGVSLLVMLAVYRSVIGKADFGLSIAGPSGVMKSELAAIAQAHFGRGFNSRSLPGSWSSTENALEAMAFYIKNGIFVIDDFAPQGNSQQRQKLAQKAERIWRAQGNTCGRSRMHADSTLRLTKPPRGLIISTGEDVPQGHSIRARQLILELGPGDMNVERLSTAQQHASNGIYAQALWGFIHFLAPRYGDVESQLAEMVTTNRDAFQTGHARTPEILAQLQAGARFFLDFALAIGAINIKEQEELMERANCWLHKIGEQQRDFQSANEPVQVFFELLRAALVSGRAHVAALDGRMPSRPGVWGWREFPVRSDNDDRTEWRQQGEKIGWVKGDDLFLSPISSFRVAMQMAGADGDGLVISLGTLKKRISERGFLVSKDAGRQTHTVRKAAEGGRPEVLHLHCSRLLLGDSAQPDQPDHFDHTNGFESANATDEDAFPSFDEPVADILDAATQPAPPEIGEVVEAPAQDIACDVALDFPDFHPPSHGRGRASSINYGSD